MPIPFLTLPSLVQLEVLRQMEFQEVFLLSLCSEKSNRVAQSMNMRPLKIIYVFSEKCVQADVAYDPYDRMDGVANLKFVSSVSQGTSMKLGGNAICYKFVNKFPESIKFGHELHCLDEHSALESLQSHMNNLFHYQPQVHLHVFSLRSMYQSGIIKDVTDTYFSINELNTKQLENFLAIHPNQNSLQLATKLVGPPFGNDSKLWDIKGLYYIKRGETIFRREIDVKASEIMRNFVGEHLFMDYVVYDIRDWIHVIRSWKTKEAYQNLKRLYTKARRNTSIFFEHAIAEFNFVKWDGQRRPRIAKFDTKIVNIKTRFFGGRDCSDWLDIQQDGGGKWASIEMTFSSINFVVWD